MIKVNLLLVKKRKKAKPIPTFLLSTIGVTLAVCAILIYLIFFFSSRLAARQKTVADNAKKIEELQRKIKAVEDYEKMNAVYKQRKEIIEQLGKNKTVPVKVIDEVSTVLPAGVWLTFMELRGTNLNLNGTGFTNTDVVNFVNNLKESRMFADVYLLESIQANISGFDAYNFKISLKVNI